MKYKNLFLMGLFFISFSCAPFSPSLKGSTKNIISTRYGEITILESKGDYELIKVSIPYRLDKICIVKGETVIDEYPPYKTDKALRTFKTLTRK